MPIPASNLPQRAEIRRKSDVLGSASFPFTISSAASFAEAVRLVFLCEGLNANATVTVDGIGPDSNTQTEDVALTPTSGAIRTINSWTYISQISSINNINGSLTIRATQSSGEAAVQNTIVHSALPCRLQALTQPILRETSSGLVEAATFRLFHNMFDLLPDDLITVGNEVFQVEHPTVIYGSAGPHHAETALRRFRST